MIRQALKVTFKKSTHDGFFTKDGYEMIDIDFLPSDITFDHHIQCWVHYKNNHIKEVREWVSKHITDYMLLGTNKKMCVVKPENREKVLEGVWWVIDADCTNGQILSGEITIF